MDIKTLALFLGGLALLIGGGELLVRGASNLALRFGISPLVVGLTVVAFGTSSPELAVSLKAALAGQADLAVGNVVGSNIFNVLFILGLSALIVPLAVSRQLVWLDTPLMVGAALLLALLALDGSVGRGEGVVLFGGLLAYLGFQVYMSRKESSPQGEGGAEAAGEKASGAWWAQPLLIVAGLALLVVGSGWLVNSAVAMARVFGLSELVIGLTIVAAGTSMPEVATSLIAAFRGERDIAVGNVVGSNIFNILGVLGLAAALSPQGVAVGSAALVFDIPVMLAVSVACLPIFFTGHLIARWEGALFLAYYLAYIAYLVLHATHHDALPAYSALMMLFVVPLTVITLGVVLMRSLRA